MEKKNFLWGMLAILMVTMLSVGFAACGSDDDDNKTSNGVVGTWSGRDGSSTVTLTFNSNNTGMYIESYIDSYSGGKETESASFTYSMVDGSKGIMMINVPDKWYSGSSTWTYYFVINGNSMSVYEDDFYDDLEYVLTKQ